jgi:hypothetical protein
MRIRTAFILAIAISLFGELHSQSIFNPNIIPLGDKESLMGNTGTGGIKSTGAVYYNPAALTMLEGNSFSLSASAYMRYKATADPIAVLGDEELVFEAQDYQSIPTSVIMVRKKGDWVLALSILIPLDFVYDGQDSWNISIDNFTTRFQAIQNYRENVFLAGLSGSRDLGNGFSVGATVYGSSYNLNSFVDINATIQTLPDLLSVNTTRTRVSPVDLLLIAGIQKRFEKWNLGLTITTPNIPVIKNGSHYEYSFNNLTNPTTSSLVDERDLKGQFKYPFEFRFGAVYNPSSQTQIAVDLSYRTERDFYAFEDYQEEDFFRDTKGQYRASAGIEQGLSEKFSLYLGGSYTPSSLESAEFDAGEDFVGGYTGIKLFTEHLETSAGFFYSWGRGERFIEDLGTTSTQTYEYFGFILGSNYKF